MGGVIDSAAIILSHSTSIVEISAQNLSNISTSGYKRRIAFAEALGVEPAPTLSTRMDFSAGKVLDTGAPEDLAIVGRGFFAVRSGEAIAYTREGRFQRQDDGRLVTASGGVLQAEGGRDLILPAGARFEVAPNGVVLVDGEPREKLALVDIEDPSVLVPVSGDAFRAPDGAVRSADITVRQGAVEAANVASGEEMVAMMAAVRRAEAGQRLVNVYDDLMGRAMTTFGQV